VIDASGLWRPKAQVQFQILVQIQALILFQIASQIPQIHSSIGSQTKEEKAWRQKGITHIAITIKNPGRWSCLSSCLTAICSFPVFFSVSPYVFQQNVFLFQALVCSILNSLLTSINMSAAAILGENKKNGRLIGQTFYFEKDLSCELLRLNK